MNIDAKLLSKILANRIQEHMRKTIKPDQVRYNTETQGWFNMKICQCNPLYKQTEEKTHMMISLDAEKIIDNIQHSFLIKVLERAGIKEHI